MAKTPTNTHPVVLKRNEHSPILILKDDYSLVSDVARLFIRVRLMPEAMIVHTVPKPRAAQKLILRGTQNYITID